MRRERRNGTDDSNHYGGICLGGKTRPGNSPGLYTNYTLSQKAPYVKTDFQRQGLIVGVGAIESTPAPLTAEGSQSIAVGSAGIPPAFFGWMPARRSERARKAPPLQTARDVS